MNKAQDMFAIDFNGPIVYTEGIENRKSALVLHWIDILIMLIRQNIRIFIWLHISKRTPLPAITAHSPCDNGHDNRNFKSYLLVERDFTWLIFKYCSILSCVHFCGTSWVMN